MSSKALDLAETKPLNRSASKAQNLGRKKFKHDRGSRKRSKSFSGCGPINAKPVLPTKFLLGGNINDPLNLNSLQNEEINRAMNAVTPKSSPLPTPPRSKMPIEVIVSPNTHDPLHLMDCKDDQEYEEQLCSPVKKGRKKRLKKRRTMSGTAEGSVPDTSDTSEARTPEATIDSAKIPEDPEIIKSQASKICRALSFDFGKEKKDKIKRRSEDASTSQVKRFKSSMDKIVSPVVPQPGAWLKRSNSIKLTRPRQNKVTIDKTLPHFKEKNKRFQYGNYNRYYGYRNPNNETDYRLKVFSHHPFLFENKDILDVGCNIGHITLSVARDFGARSVTGIDIDPKLINIARKNIRHYVKTAEKSPNRSESTPNFQTASDSSSEFFPLSLPLLYGPIDIPGFHDTRSGKEFPKNVSFKQCNYVLDNESLLSLEQPQFDVILCLSITKWIHLNWGDNGLKVTFRRMYEQLRPGGKLILEPQHWASYKSKKNLTEVIFKNYKEIEFFPDKFSDYLLSPAVGFAKSEILGYPQHKSCGFRRPIQVFTKSSTTLPSDRIEATPGNLSTGTCRNELQPVVKKHVYTDLIQSSKNYCESPEQNNIETYPETILNNCAESLKDVASKVLNDLNEDSVDSENSEQKFEDLVSERKSGLVLECSLEGRTFANVSINN